MKNLEDISDFETLSLVISRVLEGSFHDATLLVEGEEIPVHKNILTSWSSYFKEIFEDAGQSSENANTQESAAHTSQHLIEIKDVKIKNNNVYELTNIKVEVFKGILDYMYSGKYQFKGEMENHWHALELAHLYNLESLETKLVQQLVKSINVENFADFFNFNIQIHYDLLENSCLDFLKTNADEIAKSDSFPKLSFDSLLSLLGDDNFATAELVIFRAAEKWANVNKPNQENINAIVKKIRLATLSQEDLFVVVAASTDLPLIDILEPMKSITMNDEASTNFREQTAEIVEKNVALSSLGAKVLTGSSQKCSLISGSEGWTTHRVGGKPDCITVQLDKLYRINHLKFILNSDEGRTYHIEVSTDGVEWSKIVDYSNIVRCNVNQLLRFNPREVKFIKFTGVNCRELTISSLEAMYSTSECNLIDGVPVATSNVALYYNGATTSHGNCIDGKEDTFDNICYKSPILITLQQPYWISSVRMLINARGYKYSIESSADGESWEPVCDEVLGDEIQVWREFEFSRRVVVQFRIKNETLPNNTHRFSNNCKFIVMYCFESPASTIAVTGEHL